MLESCGGFLADMGYLDWAPLTTRAAKRLITQAHAFFFFFNLESAWACES